MNEYKNIDGMPNPKKQIGDKDSVDADKFKKSFKVDASEETGKREKRNRPKKAEEEDEDDTTASIPVPHGLFKEYMSKEDKKASLLDADGGIKAHFVPDGKSSTPPKDMHIGEAEPGAESNITVGAPEPTSNLGGSLDDDEPVASVDESAPPPPIADPEETVSTPSPAPSFDEDDNYVGMPDEEPPPPTTPAPKTENQQKAPTSDDTKKTSKTQEDESPKKTTTKKTDEKKKSADTLVKDEKTKPEEIKVAAAKKKEKTETESTDTTSKSKANAPITESAGLSDQKHEGDKDKHEESTDQIAPVASPLASPTGLAIPPLSPFSNMPKDVFELFEKMVGFMQIEKDSGKSTTTVTLNMPNSVFNKCELVLEHFDTAPHAYNAQLLGNPEAVEKFAKNIKALNSAITESKLTFSIHVLPPKLSKSFMGRVDRKDSDSDGGSGGEKDEKDTGA